MREPIYLDHAATTPMHPEVIEVIHETMQTTYGNPSSIHEFGRVSSEKLAAARRTFAKSLNATPNEITITSGGTESDNTAIIKTAETFQDRGKHLITSQVEHPGVLRAMEYLEDKGFEVTYLPVNEKGRVSVEDVEKALREDTILVSIMYGNNETGTVMPIQEIGELLQDKPTYFHTDAVQAYGLLDIDVERDGIDMLSVSGHKLNGPKGVGFLYVRENIYLPGMIMGGEQESKHRAGTENIPNIVGFQKAVEISQKNRAETRQKAVELGDYLMEQLDEKGIDYAINGDRDHTIGHVLNLHFKGIPSEQLIIQFDLNGIAVSAGSACSAGNVDPSHVLVAMYGEGHPAISESIRFSFGLGNKKSDIDAVVDVLERIKARQ